MPFPQPSRVGTCGMDDATKLLAEEHLTMNLLLTQWLAEQQRLHEALFAANREIVEQINVARSKTLQELEALDPDFEFSHRRSKGDSSDQAQKQRGIYIEENEQRGWPALHKEDPLEQVEFSSSASNGQQDAMEDSEVINGMSRQKTSILDEAVNVQDEMEQISQFEDLRNCWRRCSGMHTVEDWVSNYRAHPAGWCALLLIQGIHEVSERLRLKVDNCAIYSALFLSISVTALVEAPDCVTDKSLADRGDIEWWEFHIRARLFFYCVIFGIAAHTLSILIAMAFINALNETARDSDVYRMFSRGKGFLATVNCEWWFTAGIFADYVGVLAISSAVVTWIEALVVFVIFTSLFYRVYKSIATPLFKSASVVNTGGLSEVVTLTGMILMFWTYRWTTSSTLLT